jgi:hypothetical protein
LTIVVSTQPFSPAAPSSYKSLLGREESEAEEDLHEIEAHSPPSTPPCEFSVKVLIFNCWHPCASMCSIIFSAPVATASLGMKSVHTLHVHLELLTDTHGAMHIMCDHEYYKHISVQKGQHRLTVFYFGPKE